MLGRSARAAAAMVVAAAARVYRPAASCRHAPPHPPPLDPVRKRNKGGGITFGRKRRRAVRKDREPDEDDSGESCPGKALTTVGTLRDLCLVRACSTHPNLTADRSFTLSPPPAAAFALTRFVPMLQEVLEDAGGAEPGLQGIAATWHREPDSSPVQVGHSKPSRAAMRAVAPAPGAHPSTTLLPLFPLQLPGSCQLTSTLTCPPPPAPAAPAPAACPAAPTPRPKQGSACALCARRAGGHARARAARLTRQRRTRWVEWGQGEVWRVDDIRTPCASCLPEQRLPAYRGAPAISRLPSPWAGPTSVCVHRRRRELQRDAQRAPAERAAGAGRVPGGDLCGDPRPLPAPHGRAVGAGRWGRGGGPPWGVAGVAQRRPGTCGFWLN